MKSLWLSLLLGFLASPVVCLGQDGAGKSAPAADAKKEPDREKPAAKEGSVDGYLFFASKDPKLPASSEELEEDIKSMDQKELQDLRQRLAKAFPEHPHYQMLGRHSQSVLKEYESWVVPSKDLCLKIDSRGPAADGTGIKLHVQLWQDRAVLVKCDAILKLKTPIFIGGPNWRGGRLVFVVVQK
jgi:hypothetical protein